MIWVLRQSYGLSKQEIAAAVQRLCGIEKVVLDRAAVEAGLKAMEAGADFADGVIAFEGYWLGGETFVSFDKKAAMDAANPKVIEWENLVSNYQAVAPGSDPVRHWERMEQIRSWTDAASGSGPL